ncbi:MULTISPECIES: GNAT family N-acetyltransferase [unclassified Desulfovibrio]|uniref:GNAT family N-acetyltransferase n=1 Tax=unclassified Desulfovibrio TaxID=2593640 RepID=UPI000F5ED536|nr:MULTISPECIES: GNAT family N-acetyltransferase [unclassified Desulfovibrio]RRD70072.1 N-acetyltransferase [Desulfovibrio sp. OH1209_COT-279]RRD86616.1 N-acetyltransferase [Desulfovibrio sp. OH1186_COT-070]
MLKKVFADLSATMGFTGCVLKMTGRWQERAWAVRTVLRWDAHFNVQELCIAPAFQRKRFGAMLLEELKRRLPEKGIVKILLITVNNPSILDFYRNNGFEPLTDVTILGMEIS